MGFLTRLVGLARRFLDALPVIRQALDYVERFALWLVSGPGTKGLAA